MRPRHLVVTWLASVLLAGTTLVVACGDDDAVSSGDAGTVDAAAEAAPAAGEGKQSGRIVRAQSQGQPVEGATVIVGERSVTTGADGTYELVVPKGVAYTMKVTAPEHYALLEQEWILRSDALARGDTQLLPSSTANLLAAFFPGRDPAKALVAVRVTPLPPCDSEEGAVVTIEPRGAADVRYFSGGIPSATATSVKKDESISAAFFNVEPNTVVKVGVTAPGCEALPFPVEQGEVTYTGSARTEPGEALTYVRVFLGPRLADAGGG